MEASRYYGLIENFSKAQSPTEVKKACCELIDYAGENNQAKAFVAQYLVQNLQKCNASIGDIFQMLLGLVKLEDNKIIRLAERSIATLCAQDLSFVGRAFKALFALYQRRDSDYLKQCLLEIIELSVDECFLFLMETLETTEDVHQRNSCVTAITEFIDCWKHIECNSSCETIRNHFIQLYKHSDCESLHSLSKSVVALSNLASSEFKQLLVNASLETNALVFKLSNAPASSKFCKVIESIQPLLSKDVSLDTLFLKYFPKVLGQTAGFSSSSPDHCNVLRCLTSMLLYVVGQFDFRFMIDLLVTRLNVYLDEDNSLVKSMEITHLKVVECLLYIFYTFGKYHSGEVVTALNDNKQSLRNKLRKFALLLQNGNCVTSTCEVQLAFCIKSVARVLLPTNPSFTAFISLSWLPRQIVPEQVHEHDSISQASQKRENGNRSSCVQNGTERHIDSLKRFALRPATKIYRPKGKYDNLLGQPPFKAVRPN